jgi:asparagine synthase (glutamine-hydrolysing)
VHRGPDQQGIYEGEAASLATVRLKIIDLAGGDQPIHSDDGRVVIAFNGEIYNYRELKRELEGLGARFHTNCDTEVVLRAFEQWDTGCFGRLRGMFAVALWTESERRLVLARDRLGIKPLYLHRRGRDLYFGSEIKAIFAHPEVERAVDRTGLTYYLSLNYVPGPHTLASGIVKLPPGHLLDWRNGSEQMTAYWKLEFQPDSRIKLGDAKAELDELLRNSVREHLVSDVPLGIWASGGLDSTTVLHYAAQARGSGLKTFSVSFRGRSFDESKYFRPVAEMYGTDHHEFDLNPEEDLEAAVREIPYFADEPCADAGALPVWFLSRMTRQQVTVALSGEGADELFGGYQTYLANRYARVLRLAPAATRRALLGALRLWPASNEKIGLDYKVKRMLEGSLLEPHDAHLYWNGTFSLEQKEGLTEANGHIAPRRLFDALPGGGQGSGAINKFLWLDQLHYLPDDILNKCDRMSMAHALEVRPPFLDHRIVEFAARLPESLKVRGSRLKYVLRELMTDKLSPAVLNRPKQGFDIPAHDWFRTSLRPLLAETLNERTVRESGIFRWPAIAQLIDDHQARRTNAGYHLWGLSILFLWMRRWKMNIASEPEAQSAAVERPAGAGD